MAGLSRWSRLTLFTLVAIYLLLPVAAIVLYSVATSWTAHAHPDGYTIAHWVSALGDARMLSALGRTFMLAAGVVLIDLALVIPVVYWQQMRNPKIRVAVELAAAIPFVLPFIVIAFGILRLSGAVAPWALGTPWLLLFGQAAIAFPFVYWAIDAAMAGIGVVEMDEAARMCGANAWQTLWLVIVPDIGPGIASGAMLVFALSFGEFALAQMLVGARYETVSLYSMDLLAFANSDYPTLAVLTVLTIAILLAVSAAVVLLNRGEADRTLPGAKITASTGER
jgi:putative spermidine/putrescine transport system permease protein